MTSPQASAMMIAEALMVTTRPFVHVVGGSTSDLFTLHYYLDANGAKVRELRGDRIRSDEGLFSELASAWQFPEYFGYNWAAVEDCLYVMEGEKYPAGGYFTMVRNASRFLKDDDEGFGLFIRHMERACLWWSTAQVTGRRTEPLPFHLMFQEEESKLATVRSRVREHLLDRRNGDEFSIEGISSRS